MGPETILSREVLDELVRRIVETVHPRRIILFGSAAGERMGPHSDVDLLVVVSDGTHRRKTAQTLYRSLPAIGIGKDIIVVTESDLRNYADNSSLVVYPALREGREIYVAGG